jgi:pimeloyl-ACP methyl ester carboxylesterase
MQTNLYGVLKTPQFSGFPPPRHPVFLFRIHPFSHINKKYIVGKLWAALLVALFFIHYSTSQSNMEKKTFILIHGSWHSAWNWHKVIPILEKQGHQVIAIDLLGMGRDKTPIQEATLEKNVEYVCKIMDGLEGKVILLGHSKNGIVISQVAEYRPHKIEKLIYLAAYLVPNGKTQAEYSLQDTQGVLKPYVTRFPETHSHTLRPEIYKEGLYHDCPDDITEAAKLILSHENALSGATPLQLSDKNFGSVRRFYIECTEDRAVTPFIQQKMYHETPCEKVYQMHTSHSPFFSKPKELCDILMEIAFL